jgi:hypothetical protein
MPAPKQARPSAIAEPSANLRKVVAPIDGSDESGATSALPRGWHGMTLRNQSRYTPNDWKAYNALGAPTAFIVDVADYSPAWRAGLRSGSWIVQIDGKSFEAFERIDTPVGAAVLVKAFHAVRGPMEANVTLAERPKVKRAPRIASRARVPHVECGRAITREDRPKWLTKLAMARHLSFAARTVGAFLCGRAIGPSGSTDRWTYKAIARELGMARATVQRSVAELRQAGFLAVQSGRRARRINGYTLTWPLEPEAVVVPFVAPDRPSAEATRAPSSKPFIPRAQTIHPNTAACDRAIAHLDSIIEQAERSRSDVESVPPEPSTRRAGEIA